MDVIGSSLGNGTGLDLDDPDIDQKPIIVKASLEDSQNKKFITTLASTKLPLDNSFSGPTTGTIYRVLPIKVDTATVETIGDTDVPVTPILSAPITNDTSEPRLTLLSSADTTSDSNSTVVVSGGQLYVISESPNVTSSGRPFLPRTTDTVINQKFTTTREEKRRVTHNEVERRRRDKINSWICKLAKILPEGSDIQPKPSQVSKGGILAKACEYIEQLRNDKKFLSEKIITLDKEQNRQVKMMEQELEILKKENNQLKSENARLKANIYQNIDEVTYQSIEEITS